MLKYLQIAKLHQKVMLTPLKSLCLLPHGSCCNTILLHFVMQMLPLYQQITTSTHTQYILARVIPYVFTSKPNEELYYNVFNLLLVAISCLVVHILGQAIQFIVTIHIEF